MEHICFARPVAEGPPAGRHHPVSRWAKSEAFFFNQGANIAFLSLMATLNILMMVWGAYDVTGSRLNTSSDLLRITLPIARAGGRVVTWNASLIFLSGSKYLWTILRQSPLNLGFPIDNIMPYYHKIFAWTMIFMGCVVHTIPQIINYATQELRIQGGPIWLGSDGLATKQLLATGTFLFLVFVSFFVSTLQRVRRTAWGFRLFWITHVACITCVLPLLIIHGTINGKPILFYMASLPMGIYIIDLFLRRFMIRTVKARVATVEAFGGDKKGDAEKVVRLVLRSWNFKYRPGQYAEIQIPELSKHEWHPFSISSAPSNENTVSFYIKAMGRWTNGLYDLAQRYQSNDNEQKVPRNVTVNLRGPFGAPSQDYRKYRHLVVIGSGIGVTPLLSLWEYLVRANKGMENKSWPSSITGYTVPSTSSESDKSELCFGEHAEEVMLQNLDVNAVDVVQFDRPLRTCRERMAYYASTLETMTVNICLFVFSLFTGLLLFSLWLFQFHTKLAVLQVAAPFVVISVFGSKVLLSLAVYGVRYIRSFVFALEAGIVALDFSSFALSILSLKSDANQDDDLHLVFFGLSLLLQFIRIFHTFYASARPPPIKEPSQGTDEIQSVTGVWVAKRYGDMSFAVPSLLATLPELSNAFSLRLFVTREKEEEVAQNNPMVDHGPNHCLSAGRPVWETTLTEALDKAHASNPDGDAVGVFFCGSPAIARTLQRTAQAATAKHQDAVRRATGSPCNCRIAVHKENF